VPAKLVLAVIVPLQPFLLSLLREIRDEYHCHDADDESLSLASYKLYPNAGHQYRHEVSDRLFHYKRENLKKLILN
jgi:hypothetical protein